MAGIEIAANLRTCVSALEAIPHCKHEIRMHFKTDLSDSMFLAIDGILPTE
jgi:hypothetical protein